MYSCNVDVRELAMIAEFVTEFILTFWPIAVAIYIFRTYPIPPGILPFS